LLDYLSQTDIIESTARQNDIKQVSKNIADILDQEISPVNIAFHIFQYTQEVNNTGEPEKISSKIPTIITDNFKKITLFDTIKKQYRKLNIPSKTSSNVLFLVGITIAIVFLYSILSTAVSVTNQSESKDTAKQSILVAKNSLRLASENIGNQDTFSQHIKDAESTLKKVEQKKLFLNDISKLYDDINILKKQFNKIELFAENNDRRIYASEDNKGIKIIKKSLKTYLIQQKSVSGPIIGSQKAKNYSFNELKTDEVFIDATFL
jgi:hypothetical protein